MAGWTALVAGGTGLVGRSLLARLLAAPDVGQVVSLTRRPTGMADSRLVEVPAAFDQPDLPQGSAPRAAFCALGTTIRKAGSQAAFRAVDHDAVLAFARSAKSAGAEVFAVVSSVDAEVGASNFYLRTKGEMERDVAALGFRAVHIFRPSLLLGARAEVRPVERISIIGARFVAPFLFGGWRRYHPAAADTVAAAMLAAARSDAAGVQVHQYDGILTLARSGQAASG